jgi:hypothetical protein
MRLVLAYLITICIILVASESDEKTLALSRAVDNLRTSVGCSATLAGTYFDISSLYSNTIDYTTGDSQGRTYTYHVNPCGIVNNPTGKCATGEATFCQVGTGTSISNLGTCTLPDAPPPTWSLYNGDPNQGVVVTFANGDGGCGGTKTGVVIYLCDRSHPGRGVVNGTVVESPSCTYTMTINTASVCPGSAGGGSPPKGGISGGWVFIIILLVSIVLYISLGCVYQRKKKGATGTESLPNIEFWRSFPGLVKDGLVFTWTKLRGLCGKKADYAEIK